MFKSRPMSRVTFYLITVFGGGFMKDGGIGPIPMLAHGNIYPERGFLDSYSTSALVSDIHIAITLASTMKKF